jgi:hypothetical protein
MVSPMEHIQKSSIKFRCAANGCTAHRMVEFETYDEVVSKDGSFILDKGWREVEVTIRNEQKFYICCPKHDIELAPSFVDHIQPTEEG